MSYEEIGLTEQDYHLLGTFAEQTSARTRILTLREYGAAERLVRGGYLEWRVEETGRIHYDLTDKGRTAWQAYRFSNPA